MFPCEWDWVRHESFGGIEFGLFEVIHVVLPVLALGNRPPVDGFQVAEYFTDKQPCLFWQQKKHNDGCR